MQSMDKFYVSMTDKFLSGWGCAKGLINKLVFECETIDEASIIKENAQKHPDMIDIIITGIKPQYNSNEYYLSYKTKQKAEVWYKKKSP